MQTSSVTDMFRDILETDVYNCSMENAAYSLYPTAWVRQEFKDRGETIYPPGFAQLITEKLQDAHKVGLSPHIMQFMKEKWGFLSKEYYQWLSEFHFNPHYLQLWQNADGTLHGVIEGPWHEIMKLEQLLLATITQTYNELMNFYPDSNWLKTLDPVIEKFKKYDIKISEFGLRRRAFTWMHDQVNDYLYYKGRPFTEGGIYVGTSSPYHSQFYNISPKGTVAHQWYQFHAALYGVEYANLAANSAWRAVYGDNLGTALTDTFTSDYFWYNLTPGMARLIKSYRQDSGDPFLWTAHAQAFFQQAGINPSEVTLMFTDSLDGDKAIQIAKFVRSKGFQVAFGLGGFFTNNKMFFSKTPAYKPLKIVVKMVAVSMDYGQTWLDTAKLSDDAGKHTGKTEVVKQYLNVVSRHPFPF